jgi:CBS domain-containing protein
MVYYEDDIMFPGMTHARDIVAGQKLAEISPTSSVRDAARIMFDHNVGAVVVMEKGKLLGIFTERDALKFFVATRRNPDVTNVGEVMTKDPKTINPETTVDDVIKLMGEGHFRHLPVVDGDKVIGVVSQRGIVTGGN